MYNSKRTLEVFGYDLGTKKRRSSKELEQFSQKIRPRDMLVVDNCPSCGIERQIKLNQSRKNKPCYKCFHNSPEMIETKKNQSKVKSEETKQKMRDNHWSKTRVIESPFKGKSHTRKAKEELAKATEAYFKDTDPDIIKQFKIKESCTKRNIPIENFNGFSAPEGTRIRQSAEGKAWTYDVLAKANFTCLKCNERGGSLHAHHKNSFNSFPEDRFEVENGACLCEDCHNDFHVKYGKGDNTKDQFDEWLKD